MSRLDITLKAATVNQRAFDAYMAFLYRKHVPMSIIDEFLVHVVTRARSQDEYEPDPSDVQHIGSDNVTIDWNNHYWSIDDFIALLIDCDKVDAKQVFLANYQTDNFDNNLDIIQQYRYYTTEVVENEFTEALLHDPILGPNKERQFLKRYLFWLSVHLDTRVERLVCKLNNVLVNLSLGPPPRVKVRNMRNALRGILLQYAYGCCTQQEFEDMLRSAYEYGFVLTPEPDVSAEIPSKDCIFDSDLTHFEESDKPWLVIRSIEEDEEDDSKMIIDDDENEIK